jgi:hypothetical protein
MESGAEDTGERGGQRNEIVLERRHSGQVEPAINPFAQTSPFQAAPTTTSHVHVIVGDEERKDAVLDDCIPDDNPRGRNTSKSGPLVENATTIDTNQAHLNQPNLDDAPLPTHEAQEPRKPPPHAPHPPQTQSPQPHQQQRIDNTTLMYLPIKLRCGVIIKCQPNVLVFCREVLVDLNDDITQCLACLPPSVRPLLRRTTIWVNLNYSYGPINNPKHVKHTTTHHHSGWLVAVANDRPEKVYSIELYSAAEYRQNRLHYNGAGLLLHEYCHIIHQLVLPNGLENDRIKRLYIQMRQSGRYECVLRRDWAGLDVETDLHYCTVNFKEMWAELSVAYLADGYLYVKSTDTNTQGASGTNVVDYSPPFMSTAVLERLSVSPASSRAQKHGLVSSIMRLFGRRENNMLPCSKFYPFTRGQLEVYDPYMFGEMAYLWEIIAGSEVDDEFNAPQKNCRGFSFPPTCL